MKVLVVLLLAVLAVGSFAQRRRVIRRFPVFYPQPEDNTYASSLGGAPVGIYHRIRKQPMFFRGRFPAFFPRFGGENLYLASLGGAPVGAYSRNSLGGRGRFGTDVYGASLGKAPVGMYSRE